MNAAQQQAPRAPPLPAPPAQAALNNAQATVVSYYSQFFQPVLYQLNTALAHRVAHMVRMTFLIYHLQEVKERVENAGHVSLNWLPPQLDFPHWLWDLMQRVAHNINHATVCVRKSLAFSTHSHPTRTLSHTPYLHTGGCCQWCVQSRVRPCSSQRSIPPTQPSPPTPSIALRSQRGSIPQQPHPCSSPSISCPPCRPRASCSRHRPSSWPPGDQSFHPNCLLCHLVYCRPLPGP
jgi:hypothetical protein